MRLVFGLLAVAVCLAQSPTFDAVSVKAVDLAAHPVFGNSGGPGTTDPGRIHLCCVGMYSLLMRAYDAQVDQINGPAWILENMGPNLYQVDATIPPNTTKAQFQLMMQAMLAERFHLEMHREKRNFPGYELTIAKDGPKLKESKPDADIVDLDTMPKPKRNADGTFMLGPGPQILTSLGRGMVRMQVQQKSLRDILPGMGNMIAQSNGADLRDFASRKPRVVDKTGLTAAYDFTLEFACEACQNLGPNPGEPAPVDPAGSGLPNIFVAFEKQLGLKLVKTNDIALDVIVVDHVDKVPTQN